MTAANDDVLEEELNPIRELCNGQVKFMREGERRLIFMQQLRMLVGGAERCIDALLCLNHNNPTYPTKLYLAERLECGLNWNESIFLLDRHWHTFSWRDVSPSQRPFEILAAHLAPISRGRAA